MPMLVLAGSIAFNKIRSSPAYAFIFVYVLSAVLGGFALWRVRVRLDFLAGFLGGAAAGLLGLGALCNAALGGLGNMR